MFCHARFRVMVDISKINTNNKINLPPKTQAKAETKAPEQLSSSGNGVYPSGDLLRSMVGVQQNQSAKSKTSQNKQTQPSHISLNQSIPTKKEEEINKYLHSLPLVGKVISAFEQDKEGISAVKGLVGAMANDDVETSNIEMLLELVEERKVRPDALLYLCNQGIMSDEFESDLDLIYDAHINNKDLKEAFVPTLQSTEEGIQNRNVGDVFGVEGEDKIYIKTSENDTKQLDLSQKTYLRLFPPLERFAIYQGDAGNCYMLSTLDAINSNPETREKLLSCFHEDGENLNVSLPNSDYTFTMNKNKLPTEIKDFREQYSMGAAGFKILEHVYGQDVQQGLLKEAHEILQDQSQNAKGFFKKRMFTKQLKQFEKDLAKNPDNIIFDRTIQGQKVSWNDSIGVEWSKLDETSGRFKRAADYYRGRGGHEEWVMEKFGFKKIDKMFDLDTKNSKTAQELLFAPENKNKYIFTAFSAEGKNLGTEGLLDEDYGVYTKHSFSVKPKIDKNGNKVLHVSNPWNSTQSSVISYEKFSELFTGLIVAEK